MGHVENAGTGGINSVLENKDWQRGWVRVQSKILPQIIKTETE